MNASLTQPDRFGLLGALGQAGVEWGSFENFVSYTRSVIAFLPDDIAPTAAIGATVAEIVHEHLASAAAVSLQPHRALHGDVHPRHVGRAGSGPSPTSVVNTSS